MKPVQAKHNGSIVRTYQVTGEVLKLGEYPDVHADYQDPHRDREDIGEGVENDFEHLFEHGCISVAALRQEIRRSE